MTERTRTVTWEDPTVVARAAVTMSPSEFFGAMAAGELPRPPVAALLGMTAPEVGEGRATFHLEPAEFHYNPLGSVHGGVLATLLDSAMACSVHSLLPEGAGYTTIELSVNFLRPVTAATGTVRAEAEAIHVGGRVATAQGRLVDEGGKVYAHATTTCLVMRPES